MGLTLETSCVGRETIKIKCWRIEGTYGPISAPTFTVTSLQKVKRKVRLGLKKNGLGLTPRCCVSSISAPTFTVIPLQKVKRKIRARTLKSTLQLLSKRYR